MDILGSADFSLVGKARLEPVLLYKDGLRALLTHILQFLARANTNDTHLSVPCNISAIQISVLGNEYKMVTSIKMPILGIQKKFNSIECI